MNKLKKKLAFYLIISIILLIQNIPYASTKIKIVNKINNEIITNFDIQKEYNYLIALNNELQKIPLSEGLNIAKDSLIREKIKTSELKKIYELENFNRYDYLNNIFQNFYKKLNISSEKEFENYLKSFDLSVEEVKQKIKLEILWNQLIGLKYKDQINIDEENLKKKISQNNLNFKKSIEYDLSEIVFQAKTQEELTAKINEIKSNIELIGFSSAANKYSISESAKFGGKIGKLLESQLSTKIRDELKKLEINQVSKPLNIGGSFLLLFVNDKKEIKLEQDKDKVLKKMIESERTRQFDQFSQVYFNKIKLNVQIESY
ncbi:peptidylprolyl isomerase [Candidatus Pelagibacter sp.]|nr:peptidylprolyl isomerase [Candidatus Pelagibacter sp.]